MTISTCNFMFWISSLNILPSSSCIIPRRKLQIPEANQNRRDSIWCRGFMKTLNIEGYRIISSAPISCWSFWIADSISFGISRVNLVRIPVKNINSISCAKASHKQDRRPKNEKFLPLTELFILLCLSYRFSYRA